MNSHAPNDDGFTLMETLVAFAILVLTLEAVYQLYGGALARYRNEAGQIEALRLAQATLAELGAIRKITFGMEEISTSTDQKWSISVRSEPMSQSLFAPGVRGTWVTVAVSPAGGGRSSCRACVADDLSACCRSMTDPPIHPTTAIRHSEAGTSLLELLMALSLLAVLLTMIFGSMGFGRRAWEAGDRVEAQASIDQVQNLLRQLLSEARPARIVDTSGRQQVAFRGEADSMTLVANLHGTVTTGGLHEIRIRMSDADAPGSLHQIVAAFVPYRPAARDGIDKARTKDGEHILVEGAQAMKIRYFGSLRQGEAAQWHDHWTAAANLPELIDVLVELPSGDSRHWPAMLVQPALR